MHKNICITIMRSICCQTVSAAPYMIQITVADINHCALRGRPSSWIDEILSELCFRCPVTEYPPKVIRGMNQFILQE